MNPEKNELTKRFSSWFLLCNWLHWRLIWQLLQIGIWNKIDISTYLHCVMSKCIPKKVYVSSSHKRKIYGGTKRSYIIHITPHWLQPTNKWEKKITQNITYSDWFYSSNKIWKTQNEHLYIVCENLNCL